MITFFLSVQEKTEEPVETKVFNKTENTQQKDVQSLPTSDATSTENVSDIAIEKPAQKTEGDVSPTVVNSDTTHARYNFY